MKITKQSFGYVLTTGCIVTEFQKAYLQEGNIPDIELIGSLGFDRGTIPNQHIKEFEQKFIAAGGVIE